MTFGITAATIGTALVGAAVGIGATAAKGVLGLNPSSSSSSSGSSESPITTVNNLQASTKRANPMSSQASGSIQTAKTAGKDSDNLDAPDPWQPTRDWYQALGGDPKDAQGINAQDLPF